MKLVQVKHDGGCGGTVAATLFWAPDELTIERFRVDLKTAQTAYRAAQEAALTFAGPRPTAGGRVDGWVTAGPNQPDAMTLGEMRARARTAQAEYEAWTIKRDAAMRPFGSFLAELGYRPFGAPDPVLAGTVLWGRKYDRALRAEDTTDPGVDLPGSLRQRDIQVPVPDPDGIFEGAYTFETEEYVAQDPTETSKPVTPRDYDD
jgi:hypothetical protein